MKANSRVANAVVADAPHPALAQEASATVEAAPTGRVDDPVDESARATISEDDGADVVGTARRSAVDTTAAALALAETAAAGARATHHALRQHITERPWASLGVAAGVGFVVAGGLSAPALWGLARSTAHLAAVTIGRHLAAELTPPPPAPSPPPSPPPAPAA